MTIADITELPLIRMNVAGRAGSINRVIMVNQETKERFVINVGLSYIQGTSLQIALDATADYYSQINEDTTLSMVALNMFNIPLFRDIIKFSGSISDNSQEYTFDTSDDDDSEYIMYDDE